MQCNIMNGRTLYTIHLRVSYVLSNEKCNIVEREEEKAKDDKEQTECEYCTCFI